MKHTIQTILVTGGAGFIGSSLCSFLIENEYKVICFDNLDDYYPPEQKLQNIELLKSHHNFNFVKGDIRNPNDLEALFSNFAVDLVIHLAAIAGVRNSFLQPENYFDVNVIGTIRLLEAMRINDVKRIIFSSSSSVYVEQNGILSEEDRTDVQLSPYAISKKTAEALMHNYHKVYDFSMISLRLFSVYGRRQRPDLVIHRYFDAIFHNHPIEVYGDGKSARDFTHIDDVVDGFFNSVQLLSKTNSSVFEIINIGSNRPVAINALVEEIVSLLDAQKTAIVRKSGPMGEMRITNASLEKANRLLGYSPKVTLKQGLSSFRDWYFLNHKVNSSEKYGA